eukprot:COSAG01_NODE_47922_length_385_cov_16.793706_1_plen_75_part_10
MPELAAAGGGPAAVQPTAADWFSFIIQCTLIQPLADCSIAGSSSVDRPRCQPGLCMKADFGLHAAAQISAGRQAR